MTLVAVDSAKLIVLMAAGGGFALAGLWLMLRPKPAGGAKIELFGLKFEASSAGLLVFLIGAAFLAAPLFVPERSPAGPVAQSGTAPTTSPASADAALAAIPQRARAEGREQEPNDGYDQANMVAVGDSWGGVINHNSDDWFAMNLDRSAPSLFLKLRSAGGRDCNGVAVHTYSAKEAVVTDYFWLAEVNASKTAEVPLSGEEAIFLRLTSVSSFDCRYEVFTSYSPFT